MLGLLFTVAFAAPVFPGVVAGPLEQRVFAAKQGGGISAFAVGSGEVVWRSRRADLPVAAAEGHLLAVEGRGANLRLWVMDAETGAALSSCVTWTPPGWVAGMEEEPGAVSHFSARWEGGAYLVEGRASRLVKDVLEGLSHVEEAVAYWRCGVTGGEALAEAPAALPAPAALRARVGPQGKLWVGLPEAGREGGREHRVEMGASVMLATAAADGEHVAAVLQEGAGLRTTVWDARGRAVGLAGPLDVAQGFIVSQGLVVGARMDAQGGLCLTAVQLSDGKVAWEEPVRDVSVAEAAALVQGGVLERR